MSSPESAQASAEKPKKSLFKRHLSIVEDTPEVEQKRDILEGFDRETLRDRDAIQTFINTRDKLMKAGVRDGEAVYQAQLLYDSVLEKTLNHWGPDPQTDMHAAYRDGDFSRDPIKLNRVEISQPLENAIDTAKQAELEAAEEHYKHNGTAEGKQEKIAQIEKKYRHRVQGERTVNDLELYATYDKTDDISQEVRKLHWSDIKNRSLAVEDQIEETKTAYESSYNVRMKALADGKSLDEAYDLGALEYERIMRQRVVTTGAEGRREASAIEAFNKERDEQQQKMKTMGIYARGRALHLAVSAYKETLHHLEHAAHDEHAEHAEEHESSTHSPTPPPPKNEQDAPTKEKGEKLKRTRSFAKNIFTAIKNSRENSRLQNPVRNGLYRYNSQGALIRPAASSEKYRNTVASAESSEAFGNQDTGKTGNYISYGMGPEVNGKKPSNEQAEISERATSIVMSYEARDKALADGKTLEEAKIIGAEVYNQQEKISDSQLADNKEKLLKKNERLERAGKLLRKIGFSALFIKKLVTDKEFINLIANSGVNSSKNALEDMSYSFRRRQEQATLRRVARKQSRPEKREIVRRANNVIDVEQKERIDEIKEALRDYIKGRRT